MIKLKDILMESKADDVEFAIRRSFMHNPGSFNTGWKMTKREYLSLIKLLKKQYGSLVDKVVKELEKYQYIEPKGSQVIWNDGVEARPVIKEKSPKGWEGTVKSMKKDSDIDNPWALAHWMKKKGYKSRKKESVNEAKVKRFWVFRKDIPKVNKLLYHYFNKDFKFDKVKKLSNGKEAGFYNVAGGYDKIMRVLDRLDKANIHWVVPMGNESVNESMDDLVIKRGLELSLKDAGFKVKKFKQAKPGYNEIWAGVFSTKNAVMPFSYTRNGNVVYRGGGNNVNIGKLNSSRVLNWLKAIKRKNKWAESVNEAKKKKPIKLKGKWKHNKLPWMRGPKKESVNEAKPKSYKFKFKCMECDKAFIKSLKKSLEVKCPKCKSVDIEIENINEAKFSNDQIEIMRKAYGTLSRMDPNSPTYKKFIKFLGKLPKDQLKQLANAKIKFVSILAKNRLRGESVNEGEKRASNKLYVNVAKAYKVFAQEVLNLAQSSVKLMGGSSDKIIIMKNFQKHIHPFMELIKSWNKRQQENPHIKESVNEEVNRKAAELIKRMEKERAYLIRQYIGFGPQAGSDKLKLKIIKYDRDMLKLISSAPKESVEEGFGGELKGEDKKKFEKERKENAEVLGYKLAGKSDINEELTDADIKVGDAYKTTHSGLMVNFVYKKESRGGATTIEYQFKPQYGASGFMSVGSGPAKSVDGWGKHKKIKITSSMKKEMIKTLEDAMKSKYKNSEEVDVLIRNGERLSNVLSWVKRL